MLKELNYMSKIKIAYTGAQIKKRGIHMKIVKVLDGGERMSEKTQWQGLWYQREGVYSGYVIKKADIPEKARLILRYNKYYDKDSNKPRFVYCFANGDSADAITMQVEHEEYVSLEDLTSKIEELAEIMRQGNCNADMMMLPSQSAASAESLMRKAIDIIEELTGEEWNFTYITY